MAIQQLAATPSFIVYYEDTVADAQDQANALRTVFEQELKVLTAWFDIHNAFGPTDRINVFLGDAPPDAPPDAQAWNRGYRNGGLSEIHINDQHANVLTASDKKEVIKALFVAELAEVLMSYNDRHRGTVTWNGADSAGEGLSQLCGLERYHQGASQAFPCIVDRWLNGPRPGSQPSPNQARSDWVTQNFKGADFRGDWVYGDADAVSYGCALLFLYYLKSQLGISIEEIIQKGGATLEETHTNLTGQPGGWAAFKALLDHHFPIGQTPLICDDPFPLLAPGQRQVNLDWKTSEHSRTKIASGTAVTSPFALCAEKPYHFDIYSTPQILEFTATSRGFGQPIYSWWINGRPVTHEFITVPATVTVDDPTNPTKHKTMGESSPTTASAMVGIELICERNPVLPSWREAVLRVYTTPLDADVIGHVDLTVEVDAKEKIVPPDVPTSAITWLTMHNETVEWEAQYANDAAACRAQWRQITERYLHYKHINPLLTLPDPPRDYGRVIREIQAVVVAIDEARESAPELAEAAERAVHAVFGLTSDGLRTVAEQFRAEMEQ